MIDETKNGITLFDAASEAKANEPQKKKRASPRPKQVVPEPIEATVVQEPVLSAKEQRRNEIKAKVARDRERNARLVTGKFLFNECPGGQLDFSFREFPGDPLVTYKMKHDTVHTIPLGVARHLNNRCSYPEYQHNLDNGKAVDIKNMYIMSKVHRTSFIPLDFTEDAEYHNGKTIAEVTYTDQRDKRFTLDSLGR
jgi:hypothetical protein